MEKEQSAISILRLMRIKHEKYSKINMIITCSFLGIFIVDTFIFLMTGSLGGFLGGMGFLIIAFSFIYAHKMYNHEREWITAIDNFYLEKAYKLQNDSKN